MIWAYAQLALSMILVGANVGVAKLLAEQLPIALVAFLRCAVDIRDVDVEAASAQGVLVTRATPGFVANSFARRAVNSPCMRLGS